MVLWESDPTVIQAMGAFGSRLSLCIRVVGIFGGPVPFPVGHSTGKRIFHTVEFLVSRDKVCGFCKARSFSGKEVHL